jgi:hypothetical protein
VEGKKGRCVERKEWERWIVAVRGCAVARAGSLCNTGVAFPRCAKLAGGCVSAAGRVSGLPPSLNDMHPVTNVTGKRLKKKKLIVKIQCGTYILKRRVG